jgi:hypothetical protein
VDVGPERFARISVCDDKFIHVNIARQQMFLIHSCQIHAFLVYTEISELGLSGSEPNV